MSNTSNETLTPEEWNAILRPERAPVVVATLLLFIIGVCGNVIVILVYRIRLPPQEGRFYIPYLAISDLTAVSITAIALVIMDLHEAIFTSDSLCRIFQFMNWAAVQNSILMLFVIALHRYLLICHPLKARLSTKRKRILLICFAGFSILVASPLTVFSGHVILHVNFRGKRTHGYFCAFNSGSFPDGEKLYHGLLFGGNIILLFATTVLYIPVGRTVFLKSDKKGRPKIDKDDTNTSELSARQDLSTDECLSSEFTGREGGSDVTNGQQRKVKNDSRHLCRSREVRRKFTISLMLVVLFYVMSYIPFYVIVFNQFNDLDVWFNLRPLILNGYMFLYRIYMFNNVINPVIYNMFDIVFRKEFVKLLKTYT